MASYNHKTQWSTRTGAVLTGLLLAFVQTLISQDFHFVCCSHHSSTLHGQSLTTWCKPYITQQEKTENTHALEHDTFGVLIRATWRARSGTPFASTTRTLPEALGFQSGLVFEVSSRDHRPMSNALGVCIVMARHLLRTRRHRQRVGLHLRDGEAGRLQPLLTHRRQRRGSEAQPVAYRRRVQRHASSR